MHLLILVAVALAPGVAIGLYIYLKDKHEREPIGLLLRAFFFGFLAVVVTYVIAEQINRFITIETEDLTQQAIHAFIIVALLEESSKFLFVRGILYNNVNFNEPFDGIVYSVMVGMGFATFENLFYVFEDGVGVGIFRMFTAVPAHGCFAILMGYFLGKAKFEHRKGYYSWYALGVATLFHGVYDYSLFISFMPFIWICAIISLIIAIFLSRKAIKIHQSASPFQFIMKDEIPVTREGFTVNNPEQLDKQGPNA